MRKYKALTAAVVLLGAIATVGGAERLATRSPERLGLDNYRFLSNIRKLDLSRQQVREIQTVLQDNQAQIEGDRTAVHEARCAYDQGVITGSGDIAILLGSLTTAQANLTSLETSILQQITKDLTIGQISTIASASCAASSNE
jgi:hypothetical protein